SFPASATTDLYTLSLHDALPISLLELARRENPNTILILSALPSHELVQQRPVDKALLRTLDRLPITYQDGIREEQQLYDPVLVRDRKSTRLNSSHVAISYAVFCL